MSKKTMSRIAVGLMSIGVVLPLVLSAGSALAVDTLEQSINSQMTTLGESAGVTSATTEKSLPIIIGRLINQALGLLGIIMVILMIYAGFLWMTASGNEEQVTKAKDILKNAIIGAILIFAAYAIANFVVDAILRGSGVRTT